MRAEVFRRKPKFAELVKTWGDKTLLDYYGQDFMVLPTPSADILDVIEREVSRVLGADVATSARNAIASQGWVNTADHHGLLHHPYFYTASLALSNKSVAGDTKATVTLPFGGVSLGNDSFPRGFSFHDSDVKLQKIFFKSLKYRRLPIFSLAPMSLEELIHEKHRAASLALKPEARNRLLSLFDAFLSDKKVWSQETYSAQLTVMNNILWHKLFGDERGDLVYLEIDSVVRTLLLEKHIPAKTDIHQLLFKREWREKFVELFNGIQGSHDDDSGTHLFWYIDYVANTRRRLTISGDNLITTDSSVIIPLTEEAIAKGLIARTLMPSSALTLIIVQEVENLTCGGGPSQLDYLLAYFRQWKTLLECFGKNKNIASPSILCEGSTLFQVTDTKREACEVATLIDLLLYTSDRTTLVDKALTSTSISPSIDAMIPTYYKLFAKEIVSARSADKIHSIVI